jgi:hypothetical protein
LRDRPGNSFTYIFIQQLLRSSSVRQRDTWIGLSREGIHYDIPGAGCGNALIPSDTVLLYFEDYIIL